MLLLLVISDRSNAVLLFVDFSLLFIISVCHAFLSFYCSLVGKGSLLYDVCFVFRYLPMWCPGFRCSA